MTSRRVWVRRGFWAALAGLAGQQAWRHGHDYVFADQFAVVEPGKIYRGAWQKPWPMRRVVHELQDQDRPGPGPSRRTTRSPSARRRWPASWAIAGSTSRSSTSGSTA